MKPNGMRRLRQARRRGRPRSEAKRRMILRAARALLLRSEYPRCSMNVIATAAAVSTTTLYSDFEDKEDLFRTIVEESASEVTARLIELIRDRFSEMDDPALQLADFGRAWVAANKQFPEHQALLASIVAEGRRLPSIVEAWWDFGPDHVHRELAFQLRRLADRGLLAIDDADEAATHFSALVTDVVSRRSLFGAVALPEAETDALVESGVRAFLRIYGRRPGAEA